MIYSHTEEPKEVTPDGSYKHGSYMTPRWFCTPTYKTQIKGTTLAAAVLRGIKHACNSVVITQGSNSPNMWEVGQDEYLYVTDKKIAKRAQAILVKYQKLKGDAYYLCTDLKKSL
jgi:hypothetical protein